MQKLITTAQLCDLMAVSKMTVWRLTRANDDFPQPIKIGRSTRFDLAQINAWLAAKKVA